MNPSEFPRAEDGYVFATRCRCGKVVQLMQDTEDRLLLHFECHNCGMSTSIRVTDLANDNGNPVNDNP